MPLNPRTKTILKSSAVGALLLAAVVFAVPRFRQATSVGEEGLKTWFYDQSEQKLYTVARDTIPPDAGTGGARNDGVRALVVAGQTETAQPDRRRIAYLETYSPELHDLLIQVRQARAAGRDCPEGKRLGNGEYVEQNTLVRRPTDAEWHPIASPAGQQIIAEWRSWHGTDGSAMVICTP
jgi:hypothetical protein